MAGMFGTMGGLQGALGGLLAGGGIPSPDAGKLPPSGGRGGLFGRRIDPAQIQQMLAMAQAAMAGDYAAMGTMASQMQRNRLLQQQAAAEAEEAEAGYLSAHEALSARGIDKHAIHAMRPEERSALLREQLQPRQFGAEGGSLYDPSTQGFIRAPSQRQVGRTIVDMPNGNNPTPIYEGVEPVAVTDGGAVYGMRGDGSFVGGGAVQAPPSPQLEVPTNGPVRVNTPEEARQLPPGTLFQTPDGRTMRVPGGASPSNGSQTFPPALTIGGQQFPFP